MYPMIESAVQVSLPLQGVLLMIDWVVTGEEIGRRFFTAPDQVPERPEGECQQQ